MHIRVPSDGVDLVCNELAELGSEGITVEERSLDTFVPPDPEKSLSKEFVIKAYFPAESDMESLRYKVKGRLEWLSSLVPAIVPALPGIEFVKNEDWAEGWKQYFTAVRIGKRLVVKPTWEEFCACGEDVVINIDPGMAFGTGTHGTTRLCLDALATLFEQEDLPERVLDVGTGSGILAIAAASLGAKHVLACDIDAEACRTARENAHLNGVESRIEVTDATLESLEGNFQVVLANILAEENVRLAPELVDRLASGGSLILSGILEEKEHLVIKAFASYNLSGPEITRLEEWSCLLYHKP